MAARRSDKEFLDQFEALLLSNGFADLTIGDLAARLHCSRSRLYKHADTKNELIAVVLSRFFARLRQEFFDSAMRETNAASRVHAFLLSGERAARRASDRFMADLDSDAKASRLFDQHLKQCVDILVGILDSGIDDGELKFVDTRIVAEALFAAARRLRDPEIVKRSEKGYEGALTELRMLIEQGIVRRI